MAAGYETVSDIYDQVLDALNKTNNGSLEDTEFESLANECQLKLVKNYYVDVERIQKRIDDLGSLITSARLIPTSTNVFDFDNPAVTANGKLYNTAPAVEGRYGYLFLLNASVQWSYKDNPCFPDGVATPENFVKSRPFKTDRWLEVDYYNRPCDERPYHKMVSNGNGGQQLEVITNSASTAYRVKINYIAYPRKILLANNQPGDIDLNISMREELVRLMVETYIERIEGRRFQTDLSLEGKNFT